jgi:hypothetical protein
MSVPLMLRLDGYDSGIMKVHNKNHGDDYCTLLLMLAFGEDGLPAYHQLLVRDVSSFLLQLLLFTCIITSSAVGEAYFPAPLF